MKSQSIVQRHLDSAQILTVKTGTMNYPRASCGVSKNIYESFPEVVTPECFNRGSSQSFAWTPATSMQE